MMIKICGITNREDAIAALDAGATALGFNFYRKSPRYIKPEIAAEIAHDLPLLKVGVFVDESDAAGLAARTGMDVVQMHGNERPDQIPVGVRVWKAFRVTPTWDSGSMAAYKVDAFLLDGPVPGTGE